MKPEVIFIVSYYGSDNDKFTERSWERELASEKESDLQ